VEGALAFDGVDDYARVRAPLNPEDGPFSVFVWIKGSVTGQTILAQADGVDWLAVDLLSGHLETGLKGTGESAELLKADGPVVTDDNWHHVGFTWDGQTRALYVDGVRVASDTQSQLAGSDGDLFIGAGQDQGTNSFWYGLIDDVRIYNRALSEREIEALAH
jgi:sialidase-1